jgi:hypothetical protein
MACEWRDVQRFLPPGEIETQVELETVSHATDIKINVMKSGKETIFLPAHAAGKLNFE